MNLIGNLLIAPPSVSGTFWNKTVVLVTEHHAYGSIGMTLNKRSPMTVAELGDRIDMYLDVPGYVYHGGPIRPQSLSILHTNEWRCQNTMKINENFSLSSSEDMISKFSMGGLPRKWRMFAGMCGWAFQQLDNEINGIPPYKHNTSWCTAQSNLELVFDIDNKEQWEAALQQSADDFSKNILAL